MSDLVTLRDLRRGQIIAAARGLIAAGGFEALTISALEARLDFSRGVMTYHFRNKDEIVDSVLASVIEEIDLATSAGVKASLTLEEKVRAVLVSKVDGFLAHPEAARILFSFWGRLADPHIAATNADLYRRYRAQGVELLGDAAPEKVEALATR